MNKNNEYVRAANVANKFMDAMFSALNLENSEKYHITEDDLRKINDEAKEKVMDTKNYIRELANGIKVDFTDLANTLNKLIDDYKSDHLDEDTETCLCSDCDDCCDDCPLDYLDDLDDLDDELDDEDIEIEKDVDYTQEYCHSIKDRLKQEFLEDSMINGDNDLNGDVVYPYPYEYLLQDINEILDDPESEDYELIPANDECKYDTVCVTYHLGYYGNAEYELYTNDYISNLANDLRELYGFSVVSINVELNDEDEYLTYKIYMMI